MDILLADMSLGLPIDTKQKRSPWYAINAWTIKTDIDSIKEEVYYRRCSTY
jgi:hypothetical protein